MDFGDEDTNNPFVGSSYDVLHHDDIETYFNGARSVALDSSHLYAGSHDSGWADESHIKHCDEPENDTSQVSNTLAEYSVMGYRENSGETAAIAAVSPSPIAIVSTEIINSVVYYVILTKSTNATVKRRYSDFQSLRINLVKLFPTKIVPIIPEKHSLRDYLHGNKQLRNNLITDFRKRRFSHLLNTLWQDPEMRGSQILQKFLDPNEEIWLEVLRYAPFTLLPTNVLLSCARDPTKPNPYYSYLPVPPMLALKSFDSDLNRLVFRPLERQFFDLKVHLAGLELETKKIVANLKKFTLKKIELGANYNVFSLLDNKNSMMIEKIGQSVDLEFINLEILIKNLIVELKEPLQELKNQCLVALQLLNFRRYKELQLHTLKNAILKKQDRTRKLIKTENLHLKLDLALKQGSGDSPTIAAAVRRLELQRLKKSKHRGDPLRSLSEEEDELLSNSALLTAPSPTRLINARRVEQKKSIFSLFGGGKTKRTDAESTNPLPGVGHFETRDIQIMSSQERLNELTYNRQELKKLQDCFEFLLLDSKFLNMEIEKSCQAEISMIKIRLFEVFKGFETNLLTYCRELNHWPDVDEGDGGEGEGVED